MSASRIHACSARLRTALECRTRQICSQRLCLVPSMHKSCGVVDYMTKLNELVLLSSGLVYSDAGRGGCESIPYFVRSSACSRWPRQTQPYSRFCCSADLCFFVVLGAWQHLPAPRSTRQRWIGSRGLHGELEDWIRDHTLAQEKGKMHLYAATLEVIP